MEFNKSDEDEEWSIDSCENISPVKRVNVVNIVNINQFGGV
jgi:hypothetical protein